MHVIDILDTHTGGEPTRAVLAGLPLLAGTSMAERRASFARDFDPWRRAIVCEPRGSDTIVGALLLPPVDPSACTGVIFFNNVGTLGMCGHGAIGVVRTLAHLGRIGIGRHRLDTPVGLVDVELHEDGRIGIHNVESHRHAAGVSVDVPGYGRVCGDVAWGGNWFFISADTPLPLTLPHLSALTAYTIAIRHALAARGITGAQDAEIDHIELNTTSPTPGMHSRNFVLCPGLAWDRSPCGTGTSAKLACLAADGKLAAGAPWHQESILGSVFEGSYQPTEHGIAPTIVGRAHVTARGTLLIDEADPFAWGFNG
ncbi:MAG TPA: proline racemase family protein [Rhodanobacteraceae bacterium]